MLIADPHVSMRTITVVFADDKHNFQTMINGTRSEIVTYYRDVKHCNSHCDDPVETFVEPIAIEFHPTEECGESITVNIWCDCGQTFARPGCGYWTPEGWMCKQCEHVHTTHDSYDD